MRKGIIWFNFKIEIEKGGFFLAHWDGTAETEAKIKEETCANLLYLASKKKIKNL